MNARADDLLSSYLALFRGLAPGLQGLCLFDEEMQLLEASEGADAQAAKELLANRDWGTEGSRANAAAKSRNGILTLALPLQRSSGRMLAVVCAQFLDDGTSQLGKHPAARLVRRLRPALSIMRRELANRKTRAARATTMAERTAELEWLFEFSTEVRTPGDESRALDRLLAAAAQRLRAQFATLVVPDRRVQPEYLAEDSTAGETLRHALGLMQTHLLVWAHLRKQPLVTNAKDPAAGAGLPACKILSVPVAAKSGRIIGVLVFLNPPGAADFGSRQMFLARHLGRHVTTLLEAQFDPMTGLLTRAALEEHCAALELQPENQQRALIYVDIDRLHLANELHGFELGDEIIVRVAQLLGAPIVPPEATVGRVTGDCFAVIVPNCTPPAAVVVAQRILDAAAHVRIGPDQEPLEVSVSCGVAAFLPAPKSFARTLAAAEIACKAAKDHGRARIETYANEDSTMVRRHDDIVIVGQLREALKNDRMVLYAQRIVPLLDATRPGGYELLVRLQNADGSIVTPSEFLSAASAISCCRPSIAGWWARAAVLGAYRYLVKQSGLSFSINLSAQSIGDAPFIEQALEQVRVSGIAPASLTFEITEADRSVEPDRRSRPDAPPARRRLPGGAG